MEKQSKTRVKILLEEANELNRQKQEKVENKDQKSKIKLGWPLRIFVLTLSMSLLFGVLSEFVLSKCGIVIAVIVIAVLLVIAVLFDGVGVAVTACDGEAFKRMEKEGVRGARIASAMVKNCEKVASFSCDIVGDICSILSGSAGAAIVGKINMPWGANAQVLIATLVGGFIASLTVFGKALGKTYAINNSASFVYKFAKFISMFKFGKKNKKGKAKYCIQKK